MLKKCKELLKRNGLEKYIEWLVNYLCRSEAKNIEGYISNDIMWYFYCKTSKDEISKINKLPILYSLIEEYFSKDKKVDSYYCLKYKNKMFFIGNCGNNVYFCFLANSVPKKCDVIDCEKIIASIKNK